MFIINKYHCEVFYMVKFRISKKAVKYFTFLIRGLSFFILIIFKFNNEI